MCYDSKDRPPDAPGEAGEATGEDIQLEATDGARFAAYVARSGNEQVRAQVIIFPDVRGLHQFYKELALRFAERGIDAIGIDYFGRTAGLTPRDDSFEFMPHVQQMEFPSFMADVQAARKYLRETGPEGRATFTLGFCMGGSLSLLAGTE
jgi:carboxymethylenebutenolidase